MSAGDLVARRLFRLALLAFPGRFRERHGDEMEEVFTAALADRTGWRRGLFAARSAADVVRQGLVERTRNGRALRGHGARTTDGRGTMLEGTTTDVRLALRGLRREPGFAAAAICVLALGIGANTTVFSALREVVLAPPPYPDPDRLVLADLTVQRTPEQPPDPLIWSYPKYRAFLDVPDRRIEPAVGYANRSATLTDGGPPEMIELEIVAPGYFEILGRTPSRGRGFVAEELDASGDPLVVVLSTELWRTRFGEDPAALGSEIVLNGQQLRVVGIAPDGFRGLTGGARAWIPMGAAAAVYAPFMLEQEGTHWFHVIGRLVPGATVEEARGQMRSIGDAIEEMFPAPSTNRVFSGGLRTLDEARANERARAAVLFLSLAAVLVLLVACANLSGLLLARVRRRTHDGAVRSALGASRWRLVRAALVESAVVATAGGVGGVGLAMLGTRGLAAAWPSRFTGGSGGDLRVLDPQALGVDAGVVAFAVVASLATAVLCGVAPALRVSRTDLASRMRYGKGATRRTGTVLGLDGRAALVGTQIALALVLIVGAGLVGGSTLRLLEVDEGFRPERLLTLTYSIPGTNSRAQDPLPVHTEFLDAVRRLGGVEAATYGCAPLRGHCVVTSVDAVLGAPEIPEDERISIGVFTVDDEHFDVLGIPLLRGRIFDARDGDDRHLTAVINERAARELFGDDDPLGRSFELGFGSDDKDSMVEIVGVVGNVLYDRPDDGYMAEAYFSYRDFPERFATVTVRAVGDPLSLVPQLREAMQGVDPTIALYRIDTMDRILARSVGDRRSTLVLLALFAALAVLLSATGTWGIVSYSVADRRRELGLRLALGAERGGVIRSVLGQSVRAGVLGVAVGTAIALTSSRLVEALLWQTEPNDPVVYGSAATFLMTLVVLASWLPARKAARVDPVDALRAE